MPQLLTEAGAYAADHVVNQEAVAPQRALYEAAKHPQREHVEEEVGEAAVQKHIGDELVEPEVAGQDEVEAEALGQVDAYALADELEQVADHIGQE